MADIDGASLFDRRGRRKYLSAAERARFLHEAAGVDRRTRALCQVLALAGCRVSEALALTPQQLDQETGCVVFQTLKRRKPHFRAVPLPDGLLLELSALQKVGDQRLWPWCRQTAWRHVKAVMRAAAIIGPQASPKGLRHGFGIANAQASIPQSLTQRWMGHARLETTGIYQNAVGSEERAFAQRAWVGQSFTSGEP